MFDARKRAVEAAAVKAKKEKADLIELMKNKTAPQYQQAADNLAFAKMDKYLNLAGGDASVLMDPTNPIGMKFQKELNKVNNIKAEALWMEGRGQELLKAINNEQMYVPGDAKDALKKWLGGNYSLDELMNNKKALEEFHNIYNTLKINDNETYVIGKHIAEWEKAKKIEPMVADWNAEFTMLSPEKQSQLASVMAGKDYDKMLQLSMEYMPGSQLTDMIHGLYKTGDFTMSETELGAYAATWFGEKVVAKITTVANDNMERARLWQRAQEHKQKATVWENVSLTTQSPETRGVLGDINNLGINGVLNALGKTTNGLTAKNVDGKIVLSHEVSASEKNVKKVPIKTQMINGKSYNQFVENIPYKEWAGVKQVDYSKVKEEDRRMTEFIVANKMNPEALVNTYTTGYETRYYVKDRSNNDVEVTIDQLEDNPSLANEVFSKVDKISSISGDVYENKEVDGKTVTVKKERGLSKGKKTYSLQNSNEIVELDSDTKQGTYNYQIDMESGEDGELEQRVDGGTVPKEVVTETTNGPL